jgi:hypothetical protein
MATSVNFPFSCLSDCPQIIRPFFKDSDLDIQSIYNPPYHPTPFALKDTVLAYRVEMKETGVFACAHDEQVAKTKLRFSSLRRWGISLDPVFPSRGFLPYHHVADIFASTTEKSFPDLPRNNHFRLWTH